MRLAREPAVDEADAALVRRYLSIDCAIGAFISVANTGAVFVVLGTSHPEMPLFDILVLLCVGVTLLSTGALALRGRLPSTPVLRGHLVLLMGCAILLAILGISTFGTAPAQAMDSPSLKMSWSFGILPALSFYIGLLVRLVIPAPTFLQRGLWDRSPWILGSVAACVDAVVFVRTASQVGLM